MTLPDIPLPGGLHIMRDEGNCIRLYYTDSNTPCRMLDQYEEAHVRAAYAAGLAATNCEPSAVNAEGTERG